MALGLSGLVLVCLTLVKPLAHLAIVGSLAATAAALLQLYLPLWRADKLGHDYDFVGLHFRAWRKDLRLVLTLCAVAFPPFVLGHHLYMTRLHDWVAASTLSELASYLPRRTFSLHVPQSLAGWLGATWWFVSTAATHTLGVALPEETFYRGYLQPQLEKRLSPRVRWLGVPVGRAAVATAALFALGHFLGEWNPLRLGPFFPALLFAWLRNSTGSVIGAISFHAASNVLGEVLYTLYGPA